MMDQCDMVAQAFYAYLDKRVSWEHFKQVYGKFLEGEA